MKCLFLFLISLITTYAFAQHVTIHHEHHREHTPEIIVIEIEKPAIQQPPSPHTEEVRYTRNKKLALIGLATAIVGGATAVIVFLTK